MTRHRFASLEKLLVVSLLLSLALPLTLGVFLRLSDSKSPFATWLRNATLEGVQVSPRPAVFNYAEVRAGRFQTAYAEYYNTDFPARELLIRLTNAFYLKAFRMSPLGIQVGPHRSLIEQAYLEEYYLQRDTADALRPLVEDLRRLQDYCDAHRTPLLMVITPSKAAIYPENNPKGWRARYQPGPRFYERFTALLREKGVGFVDGHRITADMKAAPGGTVVFPLGSVHWSDPPALATANAVLGFLAGKGVNVQPITEYDTETLYRTNGSEADMANLLNLAVAMRVAAPVVTVAPGQDEGSDRPNIVLVGGSFLWKMMLPWQSARIFSEIHDYSYYRLAKHVLSDDGRADIEGGAPPSNFAGDIFGADAVVLECNEERLTHPNHIAAFLHDALAAIPSLPADARKPPFHYEGRQAHRWDTTLSFKGPPPATGTLPPMSGFTPPGDLGMFTLGPVATLRLGPVPPPVEDLVLEVTAGSPAISPAVPRQQVEVLVNGHPVGGMAWDGTTLPVRQKLLIPKECVAAGGDLALEFRVAHPLSLSELGRGQDGRKLGVCVSSLRVYTARTAPPGSAGFNAALPLYRWGDEASLREGRRREGVPTLRGFTTPGDLGAHTQGRFASLRFAVTPPHGAVELTADATGVVLGRGQEQLTAQVYVNGRQVGEWTWNDNLPSQRKALIPPGVINDGGVRVELRFARVLSLREMGGADSRKLGVCFSAFRLSEG